MRTRRLARRWRTATGPLPSNSPAVATTTKTGNAPTTATISNDLKANGYKTLLTDAMAQQIASQNLTFVDLRCDPDDIFSKGDLIVTGDTARCNKYENSWTSGEDDTPVYRLAEILLMRSEALARINGINQESIDLLNQIRQRSMRVLDQAGFLVPESNELVSYSMEDFQNSDELYIILNPRCSILKESDIMMI